jgi:hypothetical protein
MPNLIKAALLLAVLVALAAVGIRCVFDPDWAMRHFARGLMGGGELRKDLNQTAMSGFGLVLAWAMLSLLYHLICHLIRK